MSENLHTSLPIEYQLKYGTACGYLDRPNLVCQTITDGVVGTYVALPEEKLLCDFWINPRPITIDGLDAFLIGLNRR